MPYLTPQELPETDICRSLSIPDNTEWLAFFGGVLTELTKTYNWEFSGGLTVDETVDKMQDIVDAYYESLCGTCTTPGGYRIIRVNSQGHVEELNELGEWQDATGEYHIPLPEPREGGTEQDQICLAAKNSVNVLEQLYENLTDSWNSHLDEAEAQTAFILGLIALVGFEFAPITWGIVAFMTAVFSALYTTLEFIGADLWDSAVSEQIECFLIECATNTDGVVTFDYECFTDKLNSLTDTFSLTEDQLRLYLQISFMLYFIGGMDGLNLAGATTAITDADCSFCDPAWCIRIDFRESMAGFAACFREAGCSFTPVEWARWVDGEGWLQTLGSVCPPGYDQITQAFSCRLNSIELWCTNPMDTDRIRVYAPGGDYLDNSEGEDHTNAYVVTDGFYVYTLNLDTDVTGLAYTMDNSTSVGGCAIMVLRGTGDAPDIEGEPCDI